MCQADLGLYKFRWDTDDEDHPHAKSNSKRKCLNWNEVEDCSSSFVNVVKDLTRS